MTDEQKEGSQPTGVQLVDDIAGTSLEIYADRGQVRELLSRLMALHPAAKDPQVGERGLLAVAQLALMLQANPLPGAGEISIWYNKSLGAIQIQLGVFFYRRRSTELGGVMWATRPRPMTPDELDLYGINKGHLGAICEATKRSDFDHYLAKGMAPNEIHGALGSVGIGSVEIGEQPKKGRPLIWTALKRAEVDCLRQIFSNWQAPQGAKAPLILTAQVPAEAWQQIPDHIAQEGGPIIEHYIEQVAQQAELEPGGQDHLEGEALQAKAQQNSLALFGDPDFEGFDPEPLPLPTQCPGCGASLQDEQGPCPECGWPDPVPGPDIIVTKPRPLHPIAIGPLLKQISGDYDKATSIDWSDADLNDEARPPEASSLECLSVVFAQTVGTKNKGPVLRYLLGLDSLADISEGMAQAMIHRWADAKGLANDLAKAELPTILAKATEGGE